MHFIAKHAFVRWISSSQIALRHAQFVFHSSFVRKTLFTDAVVQRHVFLLDTDDCFFFCIRMFENLLSCVSVCECCPVGHENAAVAWNVKTQTHWTSNSDGLSVLSIEHQNMCDKHLSRVSTTIINAQIDVVRNLSLIFDEILSGGSKTQQRW